MRKSAIVASLCDIKCNHTFQNLILFAFLRILWKKFDSFAILLFLVSSVLSLYSLFAVADKYFIVQRKSNLRAAFSVYISLPASRNVLFVLVICFLRGAFFVVNMTILFKYILMKWWIIRLSREKAAEKWRRFLWYSPVPSKLNLRKSDVNFYLSISNFTLHFLLGTRKREKRTSKSFNHDITHRVKYFLESPHFLIGWHTLPALRSSVSFDLCLRTPKINRSGKKRRNLRGEEK